MNKIKQQNKAKKSKALHGVRRIGGGDDLDEEGNSEDEEYTASTEPSLQKFISKEKDISKPNNLQK